MAAQDLINRSMHRATAFYAAVTNAADFTVNNADMKANQVYVLVADTAIYFIGGTTGTAVNTPSGSSGPRYLPANTIMYVETNDVTNFGRIRARSIAASGNVFLYPLEA